MTFASYFKGILAALSISGAGSSPSNAQNIESVYRGQSIELLIGFGPGGGFDSWARMIAAHMGRHIPGNPSIIPKNMPGAGGLQVANYIYNVAPKNGRVFGLINRGIPLEPLFGGKGADFDARKFTYIGSPDRDTTVCATMKAASVQSMNDLFSKEAIMGGTGSGADSVLYPEYLNSMIGTKFRVIRGFKGTSDIALAMERGEVDGACLVYSSLTDTQIFRDSKVNVLLQAALRPDPILRLVPSPLDVVRSDEDRQALTLFFSRVELGRPFFAPPNLPAELVIALRTAFMNTLNDSLFAADVKRRGFSLSPMSGAELQSLVDRVYATPPNVVKRVVDALNR